MKKFVGFLITMVLSATVFSVVAQNGQSESGKNGQNEQNAQNSQSEVNALRSIVERKTYGDNWFISLGGNANLLGGEQDTYLPFDKRLGLGGSFVVGKWFNSTFGARIQVMGGGLKGFNAVGDDGLHYQYANNLSIYFVHSQNEHDPYPIGGPFYDPTTRIYNPTYQYITEKGMLGFKQNFNYASATLDMMGNFTNLARGYDTGHNPVDVIGFAGLGAIHAFDNKVTTPNFTNFVFKVGFRSNFNITNSIAIYLEGQANLTDKEFDGYVGNSSADGVVNLSLGLQYTFNKRSSTSLSQFVQLTADEIDKLNKKINANRYLMDNQQDVLERQQNMLDKLQKSVDEKPKQVVIQQQPPVVETNISGTSIISLPDYIRFGLNSSKIDPTEQSKFADVVEYLKKNPNSKILLVGYADKKTGSPSQNLALSKKRVETVASELRSLGINSNRITSDWKGDKEQPFPTNEWNRVVVMVERK